MRDSTATRTDAFAEHEQGSRVWMAALAFLLAWGLPSVGGAATYYVSPDGADSNSGTAVDTAWKTFDHALPRLDPGDTLVLRDGEYTRGTTGMMRVSCGGNVSDGTANAPITIKAENERHAHLNSTGQYYPFLIRSCSHWHFDGLRSSMGDSEQAESHVIATVKLVNSDHIRMRRMLVHHNNRYQNSTLVKITKSHHVTITESEFYYFHRNGVATYKSDHVTFRRCYANSRGHADLPDGRGSHKVSRDGGDRTYVFYYGSNGLIENSISENKNEGFGAISGFDTVTGTPSGRNIRVLGSISLRDNVNGAFQTRIKNSNSEPAENLHVRHTLFAEVEKAGFISRAVKDLTMENITVLDNGDGFFRGSFGHNGQWPSCSEIGGCQLRFRNILTSNISGNVLKNVSRSDVDLLFEHGNTWKSGGFGVSEDPSDGSGDIQQTTSREPTGIGLDQGECAVYVPETSNMSGAGNNGADIGADITYRYQDGQLTDEPLWNPQTGEFPCGEVIQGINDVAGESCFDVHKRLNVGTNGCPLPYDGLRLTVDADPTTGSAPLEVELSASVDGGKAPYDWTWTFNDESGSVESKTTTHEYATPGTYEAKVTVSDAEGETAEQSVQIEVHDPAKRRFSGVDYYGHADNWEPNTPSRWAVAEQDGDKRWAMTTGDFQNTEGLGVGEYALVRDRQFGDFEMTMAVRSNADLSSNDMADYAVLFGWQDPDNYLYLMGNADAEYSALYRVDGGSRDEIAKTDGPLITDGDWHDLRLERDGRRVRVALDGGEALTADVEGLPRGRVGVGGYNDAASFDDVAVESPESGGGDTGMRSDATDGENGTDAGPDAATEPDAGGRDAGDSESGQNGSSGPGGHAESGCSQSPARPGGLGGLLGLLALVGLGWLRYRRR